MNSSGNYLFKSARLGFRNWQETDLAALSSINSDEKVMEFFPATKTAEETADFIQRMQQEYCEKGFCYFAADDLSTNELIGFIGLHEQVFEAAFTPCIDIGWRLRKRSWNKGFATEGARACLRYAFDQLHLKKIVSIAPEINSKSENIMRRIGMTKKGVFKHPLLKDFPKLESCVLYEIDRPEL